MGYFDRKEHRSKSFYQKCELLALHGSITTGETTTIHLHYVLSGENYDIVGGCLIEADAAVVAEIVLSKLSEMNLERRLNPKTGLKDLLVG
ncbi:MAG: PCC domain-containing protein [Thermoplasmata archaeon]